MREVAIARRYSAALLQEAGDEVRAREIRQALEVAVEVLGSSEARAALTSPAIAEGDRRGVLEELSRAMGLPRLVERFLLVLLDSGRIEVLDETAAAFGRLFEERFRVRRAVVEHAGPFTPELAAKLEEKLQDFTGDRIELEFEEAPELVAGWRARVGNRLVEADLASRARRLRSRVLKG